jgi:hypothetical protein
MTEVAETLAVHYGDTIARAHGWTLILGAQEVGDLHADGIELIGSWWDSELT